MQNIQKLRHHRKLSGFTLVELIVVITILVILGTIAFIQLQGFSGSARDSARIENLSNLQKGLTLFQIKSGTYPLPENPVNITASGTIIGYQGFAKDQIGSIAKLSKGGTIDPLDPTMYTTYSVNTNQTKMQLMTFLEDSSTVTAFVPTTYASATSDYSKRYPKTLGDTLGILLSTATGTLNQPVQETNTGVDVVLTNTGYLAVFGKNSSLSGTGNDLQILLGTISSGKIGTSCKDYINTSKRNLYGRNGIYWVNPDSKRNFSVYCDMTTDGGGWTLLLKSSGSLATFAYDSSYWTNTDTLNESSYDYDFMEFKSSGFNIIDFSAINLVMSTNGVKKNITIKVSGNSLRELFVGGYINTTLGKNAWMDLVPGSSMQPYCNMEGINTIPMGGARARLGISSNNENQCESNDSGLGIGLSNGYASSSTGNGCGSTLCSGGVTPYNLPSFGYIFIR